MTEFRTFAENQQIIESSKYGPAYAYQMIFRFAGLNDLPSLDLIEKECFPMPRFTLQFMVDFILADGAFILLAFTEPPGTPKTAAGAIMFVVLRDKDEKKGRIASVGVRPAYRNMGLGKTLMEEAEKIMIKSGVKRISLEVSVDNHAAINLYKSLGFRICGMIEHYYGLNEHAHVMEKIPKKE